MKYWMNNCGGTWEDVWMGEKGNSTFLLTLQVGEEDEDLVYHPCTKEDVTLDDDGYPTVSFVGKEITTEMVKKAIECITSDDESEVWAYNAQNEWVRIV